MAAVQSFPSIPGPLHERRPSFDAIVNRADPAEVWNPLSAIRDRIGVILVGLLIFSIVLAMAGFVASYDGRRKTAAFESDGQSAIGTITNKYARTVDEDFWTKAFKPKPGDDQAYSVDLCFRTQDGGYHCGAVGLQSRTYDGLRVGSSLKITYVPSHPDWFYVGDEAPEDRDSDVFTRMFQWCSILGLLLVIALAAMVFWQNGDDIAGHAGRGSQADDVASRFRQRHGYGRRRQG